MRSNAGLRPRARLPRVGVLAVLLLSCSTQSTPASAPPVETSTTTTAAVSSTTTLDRRAEVEQIVEELETKRFQALYEGDLEALRELYASEGLYELELELTVPNIEFKEPRGSLRVDVLEILVDRPNCIAVELYVDASDIEEQAEPIMLVKVFEPVGKGWGFAYSGDGWLCDGPNPMESRDQ